MVCKGNYSVTLQTPSVQHEDRVFARLEEGVKCFVFPCLQFAAETLQLEVEIILGGWARVIAAPHSMPLLLRNSPIGTDLQSPTSRLAADFQFLVRELGNCVVRVRSNEASVEVVATLSTSDSLIVLLHQSVRRMIEVLMKQAIEEAESLLARSAFLHHYANGISNICPEVRNLFDILRLDRAADFAQPECNGLTLSASELSHLADSLRNIDHLVNVEKHNALVMLAHQMPDYVVGTQRPSWRAENPMVAFAEVLPGYAREAKFREIEVEIDKQSNISAMPLVRIERNSYERLLHCLLSNAVKYSYHGIRGLSSEGGRIIRISCHPKHDQHGLLCMISIQNYGVGIEPDEIGRVLLPGYRGRLAQKEINIGTGLGLADAAKVASAHGGRIAIRSKHLHGETYLTTAQIILPVIRGLSTRGKHGY